jgi:hypothetical protein
MELITDHSLIQILNPKELILLKCQECNNPYSITRKEYTQIIRRNSNSNSNSKFCSKTCQGNYTKIEKVSCKCDFCSKEILKEKKEYNKTKHHFCDQSCAAKYKNSHKTTGFRRSKLEQFLEEELKQTYQYTKIIFNDRKTLEGLELDIYLPDFKLGFELNGIFHYKQIYSEKQFIKTQINDSLKVNSCYKNNINLHVILILTNVNNNKRDEIYCFIKTQIDSAIKNNPGLGIYPTTQHIETVSIPKIKKKRGQKFKINWPTDSELREILKTKSICQFAKDNGLSQPAVSRHCKMRNIKSLYSK